MEVSSEFMSKSVLLSGLGEGTFGVVSLYNTPNGKMVFKRFVPPKKLITAGYSDDFMAEIDTLVKFSSVPSIVQIQGIYFERRGSSGIFMEALDINLHRWYHKRSFTERISILPRLIEDIGQALWILHSFGWVHNDIKNNNIVVGYKNNEIIFKLIDFGKSRWTGSGSERYRALLKYCYPGRASIFFHEIYAFCIVLTELILDGNVIHRDHGENEETAVKSFYYQYSSDRATLDIEKLLRHRLSPEKYYSIPDCYWTFVKPVFAGTNHNIRLNDLLQLTDEDFSIQKQVSLNMGKSNLVTLTKDQTQVVEYAHQVIQNVKRSSRPSVIQMYDRLFHRLVSSVPTMDTKSLWFYGEICLTMILKKEYSRIRFNVSQHTIEVAQQYIMKTVNYNYFIPE